MKTTGITFLLVIFLFVFSNDLYSQALIKEGETFPTLSSVFENVNGSRYMIGMGVTNSNVKAKLHYRTPCPNIKS